MFVQVEALLFLVLGAHSDPVRFPSSEHWQDEWLLLLCLMMRLVFAEPLYRRGNVNRGSHVVQKAVTDLQVSELSIHFKHVLRPSLCNA